VSEYNHVNTEALFKGGSNRFRESLLTSVTEGFARSLDYTMPPSIDAAHGLKRTLSNSFKAEPMSFDNFGRPHGLRCGLDEHMPFRCMKKYADLEYSRKVQEWIINGTKIRRSTGESEVRGKTIEQFTKDVRHFVAQPRYDVALFDQVGQPVVVVESEFLKHNWQFLEDFVKLLFAVFPIKVFMHRRYNASGGDMNTMNKEPVTEVFREFMSCYADHVAGEEYIIIQVMDYNVQCGHTIAHHFIVPKSGRLHCDEIVFTEMPGSPCAWLRRN